MKSFKLRWIALFAIVAVMANIYFASAQPAPSVPQDPCTYGARLSVPIAAATAATTRLVNNTTTNGSVYICTITLYSVGGTSTIEYGTGATCGTGTTTMTGAYAASSTLALSSNGSILVAPAGTSVCLLAGASTTATAGSLSYVINGPM